MLWNLFWTRSETNTVNNTTAHPRDMLLFTCQNCQVEQNTRSSEECLQNARHTSRVFPFSHAHKIQTHTNASYIMCPFTIAHRSCNRLETDKWYVIEHFPGKWHANTCRFDWWLLQHPNNTPGTNLSTQSFLSKWKGMFIYLNNHQTKRTSAMRAQPWGKQRCDTDSAVHTESDLACGEKRVRKFIGWGKMSPHI